MTHLYPDFGPDARMFREPVDGSLEVWLPQEETDTQREWLRLKLREGDSVSTFNGITARAVHIQRLMEDIRGWFTQVMTNALKTRGADADFSMYIPDTSGRLTGKKAQPLDRLHEAQLISKEGALVDLGLIRDQVKEVLEIKDQLVVSCTEEQVRNLLVHSHVNQQISRISEELKKIGSIVYELKPEKPDRICVMIKHVHGSPEFLDKHIHDKALLLKFYKHQNEIRRVLHSINQITQGNMHLFPEGIGTGFEESTISMIERSNSNLSIEGSAPLGDQVDDSSLEHILRKYNEVKSYGRPDATTRAFRNSLGDQRFIVETLGKNLWPQRLHGLCTIERHNKQVARSSDTTLDEMLIAGRQDFFDIHTHIQLLVKKHLEICSVGVIVIGSAHFYNGCLPKFELEHLSTNYGNLCLEIMCARNPDFKNTHVFVLQTDSLSALTRHIDEKS